MLVTPRFDTSDSRNLAAIYAAMGQGGAPTPLRKGVYLSNRFTNSYDLDPADGWGGMGSEYPNLGELQKFGGHELGSFNAYGVCDTFEQVLEQCPELEADPNREFVLFVVKVCKDDQPEQGGWRWHKWGPYIGTHQPECEYLYDEVGIEHVYCYHIHERIKT